MIDRLYWYLGDNVVVAGEMGMALGAGVDLVALEVHLVLVVHQLSALLLPFCLSLMSFVR